MKFGILGVLQLPRPWAADSELKLWKQGLEQVELADRLGFDYWWQVEHHFLEEYSHSSAAESFLAAASQRTKRIRLGSGITLLPPNYNHPARVAERVAALDLLSEGRAEFGTGESSTFAELDAFHVSRTTKRAMWYESLTASCRMMVEEPFRGFKGKYLQMPPRNVIPKPIQKPHPPVWVACSRQEMTALAARMGLGALTFGFLSGTDARKWTAEYYAALDDCHPVTYTVNPNIGFLSAFLCQPNNSLGLIKGLEGAMFFGYAFRHHYVDGTHDPARTDLWSAFRSTPFEEMMQTLGVGGDAPSHCIGSPDEVRRVLLDYESSGVDQMMFVAQCGGVTHEELCDSFELFGKTVMPEFKERDEKQSREKARRLEPILERAMKRRVEPEIPDFGGSYTYRADGANVRHFHWNPQAKS